MEIGERSTELWHADARKDERRGRARKAELVKGVNANERESKDDVLA